MRLFFKLFFVKKLVQIEKNMKKEFNTYITNFKLKIK